MEGKIIKPKIRYEILIKEAVINCEWNMCMHTCQKMEFFLEHTILHISDISKIPNELGFSCLWRSCNFICDGREELVRHILFHAFHTKIKAIGKVVMDRNNFECFYDSQMKNSLPEIPEGFDCMWADCDIKFNSAQNFYWHTQAHVLAEPRIKSMPCLWRDCTRSCRSSLRLQEHLRSHTQEKLFGCPSCGSMLVGMHNFATHFKRQEEPDPAFKCSYCLKQFPTENILNCHVRQHINHYKCPQCEMTFPKKTSLEIHLIYKHSNSKPFKCPHCPKRFKMRQDAVRHMNVHSTDSSFFCPFPDCFYKCRSHDGYATHLKQVHEMGPTRSYVCHMCDHTATKGRELTKHLRNKHKYQWPAGHSSFRYRKDESGFYRLQTTRYESIELAEQILNANRTDNSPDSDAMSEPDLVIQV